MTPGMWIGAIAGAVLGWVISAVFSRGPKTPMEALSGDYEAGGPGWLTFLLLVLGCGAAGLVGGAVLVAG